MDVMTIEQGCACVRPHPPAEDDWRPVVSNIAPGLFVTGQPMQGSAVPLVAWAQRGVQVVIDVTDEGTSFTMPSPLRRVWIPTPDDGLTREPRWFSDVAAAAGPTAPVLVHCHMGVARAPSAAFAVLLARGWPELDALEAVMFGRPIATVGYAADALRWWVGPSLDEARLARLEARRAELLTKLRHRLLVE
jgi:hypothetical protein